MNVEDIAWLGSSDGRAVVARTAALLAAKGELNVLRALARQWSVTHVRAAVALVEGRRVAAEKFADADRLICDREAAEQTSHESVARHLAERFATATYVADLGCGMGGDSLAIAEANKRVRILAIDRDPVRVAMLAANAQARGVADRTEPRTADLETWTPPPGMDAIWLDPGRREAAGRRLRTEAWSPPLSRALELAQGAPAGGIKLAPGIDLDVLPPEIEIEFVSLNRGLRAAVAWLGGFARARRTATVLPAGVSLSGTPSRGAAALAQPGTYLYDPDPGIGRAGLVELLAAKLDAWKLDEEIAYLSSDRLSTTPFARRLRVRSWLPFSERRVLEALRELAAARVEVTRRGSPVDTNALERRLNRALQRPKGLANNVRVVVLVLTRLRGAHIAILCDRD